MSGAREFIIQRHSYRGKVHPESLVFNANLQEFADRVSYISCFATAGKISAEESYHQIKQLWQDLDRTKQQLGVRENPFNPFDLQ